MANIRSLFPELNRSADFQSAVSQNCILRTARMRHLPDRIERIERPADCKSAIRQNTILRYFAAVQVESHLSDVLSTRQRCGAVTVPPAARPKASSGRLNA